MSTKVAPYGVRLSKEAVKRVRWQRDIRAWTNGDWAEKAETDPARISRWLAGYRIHPTTAGKLQQAFLDNPPIPGLAELLESEEVQAAL